MERTNRSISFAMEILFRVGDRVGYMDRDGVLWKPRSIYKTMMESWERALPLSSSSTVVCLNEQTSFALLPSRIAAIGSYLDQRARSWALAQEIANAMLSARGGTVAPRW
jgi:hypothetical protein